MNHPSLLLVKFYFKIYFAIYIFTTAFFFLSKKKNIIF